MTMPPSYGYQKLAAAVLILGWLGSSCNFARAFAPAQNPFGAPATTAPANEVTAKVLDRPSVPESLDAGKRLIIRATEESNPQTEIELARAVNVMLDISQYDQAKYYLSRVQAMKLDAAQKFQIYEALGTNFFLELHAVAEMQPEGSEFAEQILTAARAEATSPEKIGELIKRLSDPDLSARSAAFRRFRKLGPAAIAELIQVFADQKRAAEFSYLRSALTQLGNDALPPLLGAARANNLQVQAEAVRALGHYQSAEATDVMMRTYLSPKLPESLRRLALDSLMNSNRLPADPGYVEDRFYQRAEEFLLGKRKILGGLSPTVTLWIWDDEKNLLQPREISTATAERIAAAERASDLYEIRPDSTRNRALYLLTQLEAAKRIAGPTRAVDVTSLMQRFPGATPLEIEALLVEAIKLELIPAATACCEVLAEIGDASLLSGTSTEARPIVQAIQLGDRHLQYAAINAIDKLDPQQAYTGSSYVLRLAVYLASSNGQGAGLVGHNRSDMAQTYAATMEAAGLNGFATNSSREFFTAAIENPDLEVLLVTDTLDKPDYAELVQQLRKDFRTKRIPMGLLTRDLQNSVRVQRLVNGDSFFSTMPMSLDPQQVTSHVQRLRMLSAPWLVTGADRMRHAQGSMAWLNKIAGDRQRYRFYDLGTHQQKLAQLVYQPGFAKAGSEILVNLGTPAAQRELLNFANQNNLPIEERKKAAAAFSESIKVGGTLLTREEILKQYDRYNASAAESVETQQLLGSILDAIEDRSRSQN